MRLIQQIKVLRFRSLRDVEIKEVGSYTALVGKNSSGKSNVLRALDLFFNGHVDGGKPVDFERDFHTGAADRSRRKRTIRVEITFTIPPGFHVPKPIKHVSELGNSFTVSRTWELDRQGKVVDKIALAGGDTDPDKDEACRL